MQCTKKFASRFYCTAQKKVIGLAQRPNPHLVTNDYIGPPDKLSNLRPYVRCVEEGETPLAARLREKQIEVENWNQGFWSRHNDRFYEEKQDFIRLHNLSENDEKMADKMSQFYKMFLDKNRKVHMLYNVSWYLKNFDLLTLAFQLKLQNLIRKVKRDAK